MLIFVVHNLGGISQRRWPIEIGQKIGSCAKDIIPADEAPGFFAAHLAPNGFHVSLDPIGAQEDSRLGPCAEGAPEFGPASSRGLCLHGGLRSIGAGADSARSRVRFIHGGRTKFRMAPPLIPPIHKPLPDRRKKLDKSSGDQRRKSRASSLEWYE
jgi:hypothetical protein